MLSEINWEEWSKASFERAKALDKPVFVYLFANWSHWCHVMEREVFNDKELAGILNDHFVCVRVDRDERPEIDRVFQLSIGGGWPVVCILTQDKRVLFASNSLPLEDKAGVAGLKPLLKRILELWTKDRQKLLNQARQLPTHFPLKSDTKQASNVFEDAVVNLLSRFDWDRGGMGVRNKFPQPTVDLLFLCYSARTGDRLGLQASCITLNRMYYGGIMDQIGGGFHRYADLDWLVPGFEKLLVDNAEILRDYLLHYSVSKDTDFLDAAKLTADYMVTELKLEKGFATSEDSESDGVEGKYYTWTPKEVDEAVGKDLAKLAREIFGIHPISGISADPFKPVVPQEKGVVNGRIVLRRTMDLEALSKKLGVSIEEAWDVYTEIRNSLKEYRDKTRKKPKRDENAYTHPNALAAESLTLASKLLECEYSNEWLSCALTVVDSVKKVTRKLTSGKDGLLEDYAAMTLANLQVYEVTGNAKYLDKAIELSCELLSFKGENGFFESQEKENVFIEDSPNESPNSLAFRALFKVKAHAPDAIDSFKFEFPSVSKLKEEYVAGLLLSLDTLLNGHCTIVILDKGDELAENLHKTALRVYHPAKAVKRVVEGEESLHYLKLKTNAQSSVAYVKTGQEYKLAKSVKALESLIKSGLAL
ncbi:hypothetical protein B9Q12_01670 [Candidatus Marsarchaeota G2 archaeon ECH_B_SAG-G06]|nr:MAG: hypothetical protein B9Q12_01670 [Candidatus Marsarchaeota G2 archaeon ECH_B_SAG-G06]